jgi:hypothetical protein
MFENSKGLIADTSEEQDFTFGFSWVRVVQSLVFSVGFYRSVFGLFTLSLLHDLSSNLRLLIRPLLTQSLYTHLLSLFPPTHSIVGLPNALSK